MSRLRVLLCGAAGRMGTAVAAGIRAAPDLELVASVGRGEDLAAVLARVRPDVAVDFTTPRAVAANVQAMLRARVPAVVGTTGLTPTALRGLARAAARARTGVLVAANFALGAVLLEQACAGIAQVLAAVEILELHHDGKRDAPSGTALRTAAAIAAAQRRAGLRPAPAAGESSPARGLRVAGIPVHSVRLPGLVAHQEVLFGAPGQVLAVRHDVTDRSAYVPGVLLAIRRVRRLRGLVQGLESLLPGRGLRQGPP